ncbi:uncharacterized protein LOC141579767 isoform X1 [Camelus bactrianus]|uniref:Uncharacterized protein LOC141579767 isoform X1 n=11 Tax=Camelus bactrianus TaxID=9837 RepID=A0AC58RIM9_CAMBA
MYLPAANPRRPLMHHIQAKIMTWGGLGRRKFARCWTPGAASAALEAGRRSPGELGPGRRRRQRRRLGVGVRSRELLHFFSPPRPGLGATSAAGDLPEVRLQQCRVSREEIQTQQLCGRLWKTAAAQGVLWQGNDESRSLFHCYVNEVDRLGKAKSGIPTIALDSDIRLQEAIRCIRWPKEEPNRVMKCDIPNFINTDQNYSFGEDDLLILEPPIVLENNPVAQTSHKDLNWKRALSCVFLKM